MSLDGMKNPFLIGKNIYLRPLIVEDLDGNYISWLNDAEVSKNNSHHIFPYTKEQAQEYFKNAYGSKDKLMLAVILKKEDIHIGNISLQCIDLLSQNAELAIMIGEKDYWGRGFSKEASLLLIKHGFEALNLHRIYCNTFSGNISMLRLTASLGMRREGVRKEAFYKNGKFVDIIEFGMLRED